MDFNGNEIYELFVGQTMSVGIAEATDLDKEDTVTTKVQLTSQQKSWITFDEARRELKLSPNSKNDEGFHRIEVVVSDGK